MYIIISNNNYNPILIPYEFFSSEDDSGSSEGPSGCGE